MCAAPRGTWRRWYWAIPVLAGVVICALVTTLIWSASQSGPFLPRWASAVDQTPFAYSGGCAVEPVGQDWLHRRGQGYRQPHLDNRVYPANRPPVACYNLEASTGTYAASAPQPGEHYVTATANDGTGFYDTTKIWLQVTALPGGDYELTWGTEKGVSVEWFLAEIDDPVVGLKIFSASSRHYRWRPFRDHTYPMFAVYANDTQAPPGKYMAIMGPPDPQP